MVLPERALALAEDWASLADITEVIHAVANGSSLKPAASARDLRLHRTARDGRVDSQLSDPVVQARTGATDQ
jgi:hypothetical protein